MTKLAFILPIVALASCGQEPTPEPAPSQTPTAAATPSLPPPDEDTFSAAFAAACPEAEEVSTAICRRGFGATEVQCEYGLGDDEYRRNSATLIPGDGAWTLLDPETTCAAGAE